MMGRDLKKRFDKAKERKMTSWYSHMRECYDYAVPQRETFFDYTSGQKKNTHIYDSTAIIATPIYANRIQQSIMPAGSQWAVLSPGDEVDKEQRINYMGKDVSIQQALEMVTDTVFDYLNRSNFNSRCHEALIDLAVSTAVMTCEYDPEGDELVFDAIPLSHVYLEGGPKGTVSGVWREHEIQGRNILQTWPNATLPKKLEDNVNKKPDDKVKIVEGMMYMPKEKNYMLYVLYESEVIYEENYDTSSPWIAARTTVIPGEVYGRGPLMRVLPDIKTLNKMGENSLKSAALAVAGVWTATDDGVINPYSIRIAPGIVIPVGTNSNENPTLRSLDVGGNLQFHEMEYERRVDNVNRALFAKPIGDIDDPTKSATEISARMQLDLQDAGAEFSRLINELAGGVIKRIMYLLGREGIIPPLELDGKQVKIKYTSPVSRQHDKDEANNFLQIMQFMVGSGVPPEMIGQEISLEKIPGYLIDKMAGPSEMKRSPAEKQMIKQQIAQAQQQAMAQQNE